MTHTKRVRICVVIDELGNYGAASGGENDDVIGWATDSWYDAAGPDDDAGTVLRTVWVEVDVPVPVVEREAVTVAGEVTE